MAPVNLRRATKRPEEDDAPLVTSVGDGLFLLFTIRPAAGGRIPTRCKYQNAHARRRTPRQ